MRTVKPPQPRYHSSQQVSYADFRRVLDEFHFVQSFSAKGHPLNINSTIVPSETMKKNTKNRPNLSIQTVYSGANGGNRTHDLLITSYTFSLLNARKQYKIQGFKAKYRGLLVVFLWCSLSVCGVIHPKFTPLNKNRCRN